MDTAALMRLGVKALITDLSKQIGDAVNAVPDTRAFALEQVRAALGYVGRAPQTHVNGTTAAKLTSALESARKRRGVHTGGRPPMTEAQKRVLARMTKKRWAAKKKLGLVGGKLPRNAEIEPATE